MFKVRLKTGKNAALSPEGGVFADSKALGRTISSLTSVANPSEVDGDGDGFVTGRDGRDNIPFKGPAKKIANLWSEKQQKALKKDEERVVAVAKKLKGRKPKYNIEQMNNIISNAKTREEVAKARKEARQLAKSLFEMDGLGKNGEYRTRIFTGTTGVSIGGSRLPAAHENHPHKQIVVSGEILDKDGNRVGLFSRKIYLDSDNPAKKPHIYHDWLRLDPDQKGNGVGSDFTLGTEILYKQMGINEVRLNAGLADGAYTWLRAGYQFKSDDDRKKVAKTIEERYKKMLEDAGSKEKLIAGGFKTAVGRHHTDPGEAGEPVMISEPLFESAEELDRFLKILGQLKKHEAGSQDAPPPMALTLFGTFSKKMLKGVNLDVKKTLPSTNGEKSLQIKQFDKLFTSV